MPSNGRLCTIPGCDKKLCARGWCGKHYRRWQLYGDPLTKLRSWDPAGTPCKHNGCDRTKTGGGRGWCTLHYERWMRGGDEALDRQRKQPSGQRVSDLLEFARSVIDKYGDLPKEAL